MTDMLIMNSVSRSRTPIHNRTFHFIFSNGDQKFSLEKWPHTKTINGSFSNENLKKVNLEPFP